MTVEIEMNPATANSFTLPSSADDEYKPEAAALTALGSEQISYLERAPSSLVRHPSRLR